MTVVCGWCDLPIYYFLNKNRRRPVVEKFPSLFLFFFTRTIHGCWSFVVDSTISVVDVMDDVRVYWL